MADEFRVVTDYGKREHGTFFAKGKAIQRAQEVAAQESTAAQVQTRERGKTWQEWITVKTVGTVR